MNEVFREHMEFLDNPAEGVARRVKAAIEIYRRQGKSEEWIAIRFDGMVSRKFTASELTLPPAFNPQPT